MHQRLLRVGEVAHRAEQPADHAPNRSADLEMLHQHGQDEVEEHEVHAQLLPTTTTGTTGEMRTF